MSGKGISHPGPLTLCANPACSQTFIQKSPANLYCSSACYEVHKRGSRAPGAPSMAHGNPIDLKAEVQAGGEDAGANLSPVELELRATLTKACEFAVANKITILTAMQYGKNGVCCLAAGSTERVVGLIESSARHVIDIDLRRRAGVELGKGDRLVEVDYGKTH